MNFCRSGVMVFIHPERVLREAHGVHYGEAPRAAASFNHTDQQCGAGSVFAPSAILAARSTALESEPDGSCSAFFVASCLRVRFRQIPDVFSNEDTKDFDFVNHGWNR